MQKIHKLHAFNSWIHPRGSEQVGLSVFRNRTFNSKEKMTLTLCFQLQCGEIFVSGFLTKYHSVTS
jgi:hypothetical protein